MGSITDDLKNEIAKMKQDGLYKEEKIIHGRQGAEIVIDGKTLLNFCGNNYLGLAGADELTRIVHDKIDAVGYGMASVRFICGTHEVHKTLERRVAEFFGFEDAILYSSCFDANTGLFETLLKEGDAVFSDELNHASIIDGIRLCKAERFRYSHANVDDLRAMLKSAGSRRRILIATDGVFSMDGEVAPLRALRDCAQEFGALLMVDDSHGSGVLGMRGQGSIELQGVLGEVDILTSTFGKALGGASGGFTAASGMIVEYLRQKSRPYLFSNSLPPMIAAASAAVLESFDSILRPLKDTLESNTRYFRGGLEQLGFELGGDGRHPITPVMLYDEKRAVDIASQLFERGIYVRGFTYPVVPKGKARIRVQISASHTQEHLDRALHAFSEITIQQ